MTTKTMSRLRSTIHIVSKILIETKKNIDGDRQTGIGMGWDGSQNVLYIAGGIHGRAILSYLVVLGLPG